ncbi:GNAT family N-acetyltransferase [Pontibacillus yanchengensis]|uniref:GNAT family N-acetyltransferase n=1 Tax=Pontibacillus yanchengensis TaxID=462910 RepID=UPI00301C74C9
MLRLQEVDTKEKDVLHNIMQFYIYEFSRYIPIIKLEPNGSFKPFNLDKYWVEDNCYAYFIKLNEELIGFALVESSLELNSNIIQEFFIMSKHSGNGYGKRIARELFSIHPGDWKITQIENNEPAYYFWRGLINEISNGEFKERFEDGEFIQEFNTEVIKD